jgi:hypothetical protein
MLARGAAKQNIGRGTMAILARTAGKHYQVIFDQQMMIRRRDINAATFVTLVMFRRERRQSTAATQDLRQHASLPICMTTKSEASRFFGRFLVKSQSASTPPAEVPITTMLRWA